MITEKSFLIFDEDNIYISYHPTEPIKIFNCKVDMSECEFNISKKLCWREILPVLTDYLEWLALCENELKCYFASKLEENLPRDWFRKIEVYSASITFLTLDDFGASIAFGESIFQDHTIELEFEQKEIVNDILIG